MNDMRDNLTEEKREAEEKNEELKKQIEAQNEIARKRLMAKLNRDKTAEIKELLAQEQIVKDYNDVNYQKLQDEKQKYDNLLSERMHKEEELRLLNKQLDEDTEAVKLQDADLAELQKLIDIEQEKLTDFTSKVLEERDIKKREEDRHHLAQQTNTARSAKKIWIEQTYGDHEHVEKMKVDTFRQIMESNSEVNTHVDSFTGKL